MRYDSGLSTAENDSGLRNAENGCKEVANKKELTGWLLQCLEEWVLENPPPRLTRQFFENPDPLAVAKRLLNCLIWTRDALGQLTAGRITEVEAYVAPEDAASHAASGKRTPRTEPMYGTAGTAYVYLCYGTHALFNVSVNKEGVPHAVLFRSMAPVVGQALMLQRRLSKKTKGLGPSIRIPWAHIGRGPACVTKALGIALKDTALDTTAPDNMRLWFTGRLQIAPFLEALRLRLIRATEVGDIPATLLHYKKAGCMPPSEDTIQDIVRQFLHLFKDDTFSIVATPRIGIDGAGETARALPYRFFVEGDPSVSKAPARRPAPNTSRKGNAASSELDALVAKPSDSAALMTTPEVLSENIGLSKISSSRPRTARPRTARSRSQNKGGCKSECRSEKRSLSPMQPPRGRTRTHETRD